MRTARAFFGAAALWFTTQSLWACPLCAEALKRINGGQLVRGYFLAYLIMVLLPITIVSFFAVTLYRARPKQPPQEP
jgi:uncharacterized membrane protein